jgi:hypothetical protein
LDNKEQVDEWFIRYRELHILLKNGKTLIIDGNGCLDNADFKHHDDNSEEIVDAEECDLMFDEGFEPVEIDVKQEDVLTGNPVCLDCFSKCIQEQPKSQAVVNSVVTSVVTRLPAVEEGQPQVVKKFEQDGKKYLVSRNSGIVYDYVKHVGEDEQVVVGTFDFDTQKVILQEAEVAELEDIMNCQDCGKECGRNIVTNHKYKSVYFCSQKCQNIYDADQDNFTNRQCENRECNNEFDLADPHYYDEEQSVCYCCEECYKIEQARE